MATTNHKVKWNGERKPIGLKRCDMCMSSGKFGKMIYVPPSNDPQHCYPNGRYTCGECEAIHACPDCLYPLDSDWTSYYGTEDEGPDDYSWQYCNRCGYSEE
jgi:hypothetical protein